LGASLAVAEEKVAAAGGAQAADEDVGGRDASAKKLGAISFAEVEEDVFGRGLMAWRHHIQPLNGIGLVTGAEFVEPFGGIGELGKKLGGDFGADFVAAAADGRPDGGKEVGGLGFELHLHLPDSLRNDALERAAPTGVNGGDGALFRIDEENRYTVCGLYAQEEPGAVRCGGIALARSGRCGVEKMDDVGMDLV